LHSLEERYTLAKRKLQVVTFQIPGLEHIIHTKVDSGSFSIRMGVCVDAVAVLDEKT
jgi:hypothetical protein